MTSEQEKAILEAWKFCDDNDKSTEYMLQYASDISGVDYEEVAEFIVNYKEPTK